MSLPTNPSIISSATASSATPNSLADLVMPPDGWDFDQYVLAPRWVLKASPIHAEAFALYLEFVRRCSLD